MACVDMTSMTGVAEIVARISMAADMDVVVDAVARMASVVAKVMANVVPTHVAEVADVILADAQQG
jgi:hypothetical protein